MKGRIMNTQIILDCLAKTLKLTNAEVQNIRMDVELSTIGLSSIDFVSFAVELENALGIEIRDSDLVMEKFKTLDCVVKTVSAYLSPDTGTKKCLILDADNVLWKGISGEESICIDGDVLRFQQLLLRLYDRGVLLCLCSKNESWLIEESFADSRMRLTKEHFVVFLANRTDKATNILFIADELNLSTDQFVFVDDSDYELAFVKTAIFDIETVKADYTSMEFMQTVEHCFTNVMPTSDLNRTQLYRGQKERQKVKRTTASVAEYNETLHTETVCRTASVQECMRLAELSERTHQFNLSAKQYSEQTLSALLEDPAYTVLSLSARDKFGDMGIVGMAVAKHDIIEAFMLSCRVFDRGFEYILLDKLKEIIGKPLYGVFSPNPKNLRYADFYSQNNVTTTDLSKT